MKKEIEDLIESYANREKYQMLIDEEANKGKRKDKVGPLNINDIPDIAKILNIQNKISFGKDRQRAELLKQNAVFLNELERIKNRLGKSFFKLFDLEIDDLDILKETLFQSDFAEPVILISTMVPDEHSNSPKFLYYTPGTPKDIDGWPEEIVERKEDPLFEGLPLEWIIVSEEELEYKRPGIPALGMAGLATPEFISRSKSRIFNRYWKEWSSFLERWHISTNWDGDLKYLHVHALPSVIIELDRKNYNLPVIIRLGAWATLEDVKENWATVERKMKEVHIYRERESESFPRDQIWYRLNKEEMMSPSKIAQFWAGKVPKEIDLEVIEKVTRDEGAFEDVHMEERLEEILSDDPKMDELRGRFIEARKAFIRIGLKDKVKKSIKKTEQRIRRIGSEDWDRNRERLLKPAR
jgi:hypothetical protein